VVDPQLGGDAALARLSDALYARGMRLLGDLTTNHCGEAHEWFQTVATDATTPEAGYFIFTDHPNAYVCWFGYSSLPKFDHRDPRLRRRLYEGPDSVVARWLGPHGLDGWRIDVANMTARMGTTATMAAANPESLLVTVAFGLLATMPGLPMLWAGDEIGQEGVNGEDARRPIPWNEPERWDMERFAINQALFTARAENPALRRGGLRWLAVQDDSITFLRESPQQTVLVHAARGPHRPVQVPTAILGSHLTGLAETGDLHPDASNNYTLPSWGP
jgi:glycosidase